MDVDRAHNSRIVRGKKRKKGPPTGPDLRGGNTFSTLLTGAFIILDLMSEKLATNSRKTDLLS